MSQVWNYAGEQQERSGRIVHWVSTVLIVFFIGSGGIAYLLGLKANVAGFEVMGYPPYLLTILGFWKVSGAIVLVVPGFPRLKEWAYAGIFFNLSGAAASHIAANDYGDTGFHVWVNVLLAVLLFISWRYRAPGNVLGNLQEQPL